MADNEHLTILNKGVKTWNCWRQNNPNVRPNLEGLDISNINLRDADLSGANLRKIKGGQVRFGQSGANLLGANFNNADLTGANLRDATLRHTKFIKATLDNVKLSNTDLYNVNFNNASMQRVDLYGAIIKNSNLTYAKLIEARLRGTVLINCNLTKCVLSNCVVYGCSAWDVNLNEAAQTNLVITPDTDKQNWRGIENALEAPSVTVDDLKVAQFVYLLLNNEKIRDVIDTITSKAVLILGRFTTERKEVLDAIREKLRHLNYVPMIFDFERPTNKDFTETIMTLASMCQFIIADITNPSSSPLELQATVPNFRIPFVPIIQKGEQPFAMFADLYGKYNWVLAPLAYPNKEKLVEKLGNAVIEPALKKRHELMIKKLEEMPIRSL